MKPTVPPVSRTLDMVEDGRVVVRHVFYGRDEAEAEHMEQAHLEADASLRASVQGKPYKGTDIKAVRSKGEVPMHPLHKAIADRAGIDPDAFHKGKIVPKKEAEGDGSNQYQSKGGTATADAHALAKDAGVTFNGVQQGFGSMPDHHMFTDPAHGSTFMVRSDALSKHTLRQAIDRKRREFGMKEVRAVLHEGGKGSGIVSHVNPALTAEARTAYEGGRGSNQYRAKGSSKFEQRPSGASDEERMADRFAERPAQRAQRIRAMKVDPVRAEIIKRAIGVRAALVA